MHLQTGLTPVRELDGEQTGQLVRSLIDYEYEEGEHGLGVYFPSQKALAAYLECQVKQYVRLGRLYTTGPRREAFMALRHSEWRIPEEETGETVRVLRETMGIRNAGEFLHRMQAAGESLEDSFRRKGQPYLFLDMLAVRREYRGRGFMRGLLSAAFTAARETGASLLLETDGRSKKERYEHLGMRHAGTRRIGRGFTLYDMAGM